VVQLWGADDTPLLAEPLQWCRWRDHGEFWDAWDLAADYRSHPLPLQWHGEPELVEQGPLCTRLVWRGRCGLSALRLDVQLRAASPWLELTLQVDWRQLHELLRLEIPLARPADRIAADTAAGVIERPGAPRTPREQARWEVPAISWVGTAGPGLAVLLDGPQGVSGSFDRLGVSLLRAPTWPDPGADHGRQRLRLALLPCAKGWHAHQVPLRARCFREPLWMRPAQPVGPSAGGGAESGFPWPPLSLGDPALAWVGLEAGERPGEAWLSVQNLSPLRQSLRPSLGWRLIEGPEWLSPWQLQRLRLQWAADQSS
jgi:alpha-mannosidase